jgi:hypothetical protein
MFGQARPNEAKVETIMRAFSSSHETSLHAISSSYETNLQVLSSHVTDDQFSFGHQR